MKVIQNLVIRDLEEKVDEHTTKLHYEVLNEDEIIDYTNIEEIKGIIKSIKNKKAPGEDKIQGIVIKKLPDNILETLVDIYNSSIHHNWFPNSWKNVIISPLHKPTNPSSYRHISLLSNLGKIYERILGKRLKATNISLTQKEQCGFKKTTLRSIKCAELHKKQPRASQATKKH